MGNSSIDLQNFFSSKQLKITNISEDENGTIIVNEKTHNSIAILDGRDGSTLSNWLKNNKHIKIVTRDHASAYAKVI